MSAPESRLTLYFNRLIRGCCDVNCQNPNCASSSNFAHPGITSTRAGALAIQLALNGAELCPPMCTDEPSNQMDSGEIPSQESEPLRLSSDNPDPTFESRPLSGSRILDSCGRSRETSDCFLPASVVARLISFLYNAPENSELNTAQFDDTLESLNADECSTGRDLCLSSTLRGRNSLFSSSGPSTASRDALKSLRNSNIPTSSNPAQESRKEGLTLTELQEAIDSGTRDGEWSILITLLNSIFSSYESLSSSFLTSSIPDFCSSEINISNNIAIDEPTAITIETSRGSFLTEAKKPKHDSPLMRNEIISDDNAATTTSTICDPTDDSVDQSNGDKMERHDIDDIEMGSFDKSAQSQATSIWPVVNLKELRLAWHLINELPERQNVVDTLMRAVRRLVILSLHPLLLIQPPEGLDYSEPTLEIRIIQQRLVNLFVILYECPFVTDPLHFELLLVNINRAVTWLPYSVQIQLCRAWANAIHQPLANCVDPPEPEQTNLWRLQKILLHHVTLRCLTTDHGSPNEDKQICEAAVVLRIVYYASLLAGKLDPQELLKRELEENQAFEAELSNHHNEAYERRPRVPVLEDPFTKALNISPNDCRTPFIPVKDFINETLNDGLQPKKDYTYYRSKGTFNEFSFMKLPFLLQTSSKSKLLHCDNRTRMFNERYEVLMHTLFSDTSAPPFFKLRVARERIVEDALLTLEITSSENPSDFKKQLIVEFQDEQGIDEGGLTKEFFHLIIERIFDPDYGMFVIDEETQTYWFNPVPFEDLDREYCLIGTLLGLAIYNDVILDVRFPSVLYRKLVGKLGTFDDLIEARPTLAHGLQALLAYEKDDLSEVFGCTFVINYHDPFGNLVTSCLKENGDSIVVTKENRQEYVNLYANFILNESVKRQFNAFRRGFHMVVDESPLTFLFRPDEIEILIRGYPEYDFKELEQATTYDEYNTDSPVIKNFWQIVHSMTEQQQRQLLQFSTGSDRIPLGGMSKMKFTIARQGTDTERLPTAHTCFNILLLPEYESYEKLRDSLLIAITHCKGFGMF